jgi:uncharacterized integral membrane protein
VRLRRRPLDQQQLQEIQDRWQPLLYLRLIVLGLLLAYVIAFVLENRKQVHIHFVLATASVSLIWLILLAVAIGIVGGILLAQLERRSRRRRARGN